VAIDQYSKNYVVNNYNKLYGNTYNKKFRIILAKNTGAAFSTLQNRRKLLLIINIPIIIFLFMLLTYILIYSDNLLLKLTLSFMIGGGLGNLLDRIRLKYVIDFLYINFKGCPIFNIADIFILISAIMSFILIIFDEVQ